MGFTILMWGLWDLMMPHCMPLIAALLIIKDNRIPTDESHLNDKYAFRIPARMPWIKKNAVQYVAMEPRSLNAVCKSYTGICNAGMSSTSVLQVSGLLFFHCNYPQIVHLILLCYSVEASTLPA